VIGGEETYTYDSQNRLIGYSYPRTKAACAYDALDRRIDKTVDGVA
jgi:YD repeat-containing protein